MASPHFPSASGGLLLMQLVTEMGHAECSASLFQKPCLDVAERTI